MSKQLQVLLKEFEQNAALTAILERRRRIEGRSQYNLQGREAMDAVNQNLAPSFRTGMAVAATSAKVAQQVAGVAPPDAADVMTGGTYSTGGSETSAKLKAPPGTPKAAPRTPRAAPRTPRGRSPSLPGNVNRTPP